MDETQNAKFLDDINQLMSPEDDLLISYITADAKSQLFKASLDSAGESHKHCMSLEDIPQFVAKEGFSVSKRFDATRLLCEIAYSYAAKLYASQKCPQLKEHYIFLSKGKPVERNIHKIPFFDLEIPKQKLKPPPSLFSFS